MKNILIACIFSAGICTTAMAQSAATSQQLSAARSYLSESGMVYPYIDSAPMYPGGEQKWEDYVNKTGLIDKTIAEARKKNIPSGVYTVVVKFAVNADGSIGDAKVLSKPIGYGLEDAALKLVKESGKWTPANIEGKDSKAYVNFPVRFSILY
jgi:TonB family protein